MLFKKKIVKLFFLFCLSFVAIPMVKAEDNVTVILDWFLNASHESLLAAEYSGAFKRHGLNVDLIAPADPGSPPRLLAAGQADLAISYPLQLGLLVDQHIQLVQVGFLLDHPLETLITQKEIKTIQHLKGKTIGVSAAGDESLILEAMLEHNGLKLSDLHFIVVNFQLEQALITGAVDAIIGASRNYEFIDLQQRHYPVSVFFPEQNGAPIYDGLIFVAQKKAANQPKLARFMQALKEGSDYLQAHPDEVYQKAIHDHPELDTPLNKAAWNATLPLVAKNPASVDKNKMRELLHFLLEKKAIQHMYPMENYIYEIHSP